MQLTRNESVDNAIREVLVACPQVVLDTLHKESQQATQEKFYSEIVRLQQKILKQSQIHTLQAQMQQVVDAQTSRKANTSLH
jgi:hypothetical protein